ECRCRNQHGILWTSNGSDDVWNDQTEKADDTGIRYCPAVSRVASTIDRVRSLDTSTPTRVAALSPKARRSSCFTSSQAHKRPKATMTPTTPTCSHLAPESVPICQKMICSREVVGAKKLKKEMTAPAIASTAMPTRMRLTTRTLPPKRDSW